jgi:DHA1 family bicyclomycin/chloramphenicol resistance-like MFS transporter
VTTEPIALATDAQPVVSVRQVIRPGTRAFTVLLSAAMAMTALGIDTLLPAFDAVRAEYGLATDATGVAGLVTAFIVGFGLGQLPAGILADRYGRRPVLWGGLAVYMVGAAAAALAPSIELMIAARFVWGLGAAGPRVAVTAMVRDAYSGAAMARQMSSIMAIFLIVPMLAPALGAGLIALGPWQLTIWFCAGAAMVVLAASTYLPATLPVADRPPFSAGAMIADWKTVLSTPGTIGWVAATTLITSAFMSYIASSENIVDEVFGLKRWFVLTFAALALVMALASMVNGRVVETLGLRRILTVMPFVQIAVAAALCAAALATGGTPPFAVFLPLVIVVMMTQQVLTVNINSAAMVPLGHVAGSAAAVIGAAPMVFGSLLGRQIDARFDGTVTPLSLAFLVSSVLSGLAVGHALRATRASS